MLVADFQANTATYILVGWPSIVKSRIAEEPRSSVSVVERLLGLDALLLDERLNVWKEQVNYYRSRLLSYIS